MEDLIPTEVDILIVLPGNLIGVSVVNIVDLVLLIPVDFHVFWQQRVES